MRSTVPDLKPKPTPALQWTAAFCALAVWVLGLLAANPQLHRTLHGDANHQDHSCAVTLFSHGVEQATGSSQAVCAPVLFPAGDCTVQPALPVAGGDNRFPPGRGPPLC